LPSGIVQCGTPFVDIGTSFAVNQICTLFSRNVTAGTTPTTYAPGQSVTREQMAVFMIHTWEWYYAHPYNGPVVAGFTDIAGSFAKTQIQQLAGLGVTAGCSLAPLLYCPGNPVTRAEMAVFMVRLYESILGPYTGPLGGGPSPTSRARSPRHRFASSSGLASRPAHRPRPTPRTTP
jgi:S-layer family protein